MNDVLVAVLAHPDDESFGMGGTLAKYAAQGAAVHLVLATRGEAGIPGTDPSRAGAIREAEARAACAVLGVCSLDFLDYLDGRLAQTDVESAVDRLTDKLRVLQPKVVITFGPDGVSGHSDHIAVSCWTTTAYDRLSTEPSGPRVLYYLAPSAATQQVCGNSPSTETVGGPVAFIDVGAYLATKVLAMQQHRSQNPPYSGAPEVEAARLACHEVFRLARPATTGTPIADIFACPDDERQGLASPPLAISHSQIQATEGKHRGG
jgi:LmbE family N-acetylglucosaminyl deacetylase